MWDVINQSLSQQFYYTAVEFMVWVSNYVPLFHMDKITLMPTTGIANLLQVKKVPCGRVLGNKGRHL